MVLSVKCCDSFLDFSSSVKTFVLFLLFANCLHGWNNVTTNNKRQRHYRPKYWGLNSYIQTDLWSRKKKKTERLCVFVESCCKFTHHVLVCHSGRKLSFADICARVQVLLQCCPYVHENTLWAQHLPTALLFQSLISLLPETASLNN